MLKRLIEVALPLHELSEESAKEKYIQRGSISTLHIWWARRPLATCRAVVFASLIPDPDDPDCPEEFRKLVMDVLGKSQFQPKNDDGSSVEDTPRNRCLEFIKYLIRLEHSSDPQYVEPARKLITVAHKFLHPDSEADAPDVLDPFAGGGAIPLEALRLGCEAHAIDLNPVAHLIEICTLVYPQKYGQKNSRPVPGYIRCLIARNRAKRKAAGEVGLFDDDLEEVTTNDNGIMPNIEITEAEYENNPLATDISFWGHWVLENARKEVEQFYPSRPDGSVPIAFLWARNVECPNPTCKATIPLYRQLWLSKKPNRKAALRLRLDEKDRGCSFEVVEGRPSFDFDPSEGTMRRGQAFCPFCQTVANSKYLQARGNSDGLGQQLLAVVTVREGQRGQEYHAASNSDQKIFNQAALALEKVVESEGEQVIPTEPLRVWSGVFNAPLFGLTRWCDLFNSRQMLSLVTFARWIREAVKQIAEAHDEEYAKAAGTVLAVNFGRAPDHWATLCGWNPSGPKIQHVFGRGALPMIWDYAEANPFGGSVGDWSSSINWNGQNAVLAASGIPMPHASCKRGSATALPLPDNSVSAVVTDPPYYDSVPYSDLSDFFYVWLKRVASDIHPDLLRTPLTPKGQELVSHLGNYPGKKKTAKDYECRMEQAFSEMRRVMHDGGICCVMFAHKTTTAWESIIEGLGRSGLIVTSSWPLHTESRTRLRAMTSAALASSVTLVCRKRSENAGSGLWDDIRQELKKVATERLDFFWNQGIRGADFFISAIGPALSVFGQYERVTKLSGDEVTVGQFLDEVRALVTGYALEKILHTTHTANIDPESRFYVVWKWAYGDVKTPAGESFVLAQALGIDTEMMWDKTGVLEKSGENVQAMPVAERMKIKNLGDPSPDGTPGSLIDVLHRMCAFREKGDTQGMGEFVARSGQARNQNLWLLAQAVSEILPDGEKEKQLMQGLLNQKEQLERVDGQGRLF